MIHPLMWIVRLENYLPNAYRVPDAVLRAGGFQQTDVGDTARTPQGLLSIGLRDKADNRVLWELTAGGGRRGEQSGKTLLSQPPPAEA